jgi:hypothetical protein
VIALERQVLRDQLGAVSSVIALYVLAWVLMSVMSRS